MYLRSTSYNRPTKMRSTLVYYIRGLHVSWCRSVLLTGVAVCWQVIIVTEEFEGKALLARHRMVNALFTEELMGKTPSMHGKRNAPST